jgi:hypothetical protein
MITLVSGFFVAYFVLLKFLGLGIDDITRETVVAPFYAGIPALLFIISIISFIISYASYAPILMKDRTVSKVEEIVKYMDKIWPLLLSFIREEKLSLKRVLKFIISTRLYSCCLIIGCQI